MKFLLGVRPLPVKPDKGASSYRVYRAGPAQFRERLLGRFQGLTKWQLRQSSSDCGGLEDQKTLLARCQFLGAKNQYKFPLYRRCLPIYFFPPMSLWCGRRLGSACLPVFSVSLKFLYSWAL